MLTDNFLDIDQFINADLFAQTHLSPAATTSSPSSPEQGLLTPPQPVPAPAFHDAGDGLGSSFSLFDDDLKAIDSLNNSSYDFLTGSSTSLDQSMSGYPSLDLGYGSISGMTGLHMNTGLDLGLNMPIVPIHPDSLQQMSIDPQLMDTPASAAPISEFGDDEEADEGDDEQSSQNTSAGTSPAASTPSPEGEQEKLTLTIAPIKVGGHGKARRGTVQSGGVVKKIATSSLLRDKENAISAAALFLGARSAALLNTATVSTTSSPSPIATSPSASTVGKGLPKPPTILKAPSKKGKAMEPEEDDDDDVPQDWRPSPEVFARMTSKEKRQLRNKISARNFRVRRKEYISTLEGDIAERDKLLEAIRSELGSTQSENLALRQEITALKKILLEGRSAADLPSLNLPPPAPLPVGLPAVATSLAATNSVTISSETMVPSPPNSPTPHQQNNANVSTNANTNPFAPNTQKDLPSSPTPRPFWGGQHSSLLGGMGGITPVHTALVPEVNVGTWGYNAKKVLGDSAGTNINPLLNVIAAGVTGTAVLAERKKEDEKVKLTGFDAFADANMFTMKSLDAYRMHLWGKMAAQNQSYQYSLPQQQQASQHPLTGPAASLRPAHFVSPTLSPKATVTSLLSGKSSTSTNTLGLLTPPSSPRIGAQSSKGLSQSSSSSSQSAQQREREAQAAVLAVVASQTIFKRLGSAFWDAFSGSSSPSTTTSLGSNSARSWDADKVRKVLEGKAVVKVVDVEPTPTPPPPAPPVAAATSRCCDFTVTDLLEESMRSLTLGKGTGASRRL